MTDAHCETLATRLRALPNKVGVPLAKLLEIQLVRESDIVTILDAGDLAGNSAMLLPFSIAFLSLKQQQIPISDVVDMSKRRGRRVSLFWSAARWKAEHDRLSRAETLVQLASAPCIYDLSAYAPLIPTDVNGYLIRSSRRLGMEGLRQRHCVAGYHDRIVRGSCAIATVFVDHRRWTVELHLSNDSASSLYISQIKSRYNQMPSVEVSDRIRKMLGIADQPSNLVEVERTVRTYKDNLRVLLPILREHGVTSVHVEFDGSGDSGSISLVEFRDGTSNVDELPVTIFITKSVFIHETKRWARLQEIETVGLHPFQ